MYTIKEVSEIMNISEHTLRFWAKSGFLPEIIRDKNNNRLFGEKALEWVKIVKCLRNVGVDLKSVKRYIELCLIGDETICERYQIILDTKQKALEEIENLKAQLKILEFKEKYYKDLIKNNSEDIWNPANAEIKAKQANA